jgi:hypothetical protein
MPTADASGRDDHHHRANSKDLIFKINLLNEKQVVEFKVNRRSSVYGRWIQIKAEAARVSTWWRELIKILGGLSAIV